MLSQRTAPDDHPGSHPTRESAGSVGGCLHTTAASYPYDHLHTTGGIPTTAPTTSRLAYDWWWPQMWYLPPLANMGISGISKEASVSSNHNSAPRGLHHWWPHKWYQPNLALADNSVVNVTGNYMTDGSGSHDDLGKEATESSSQKPNPGVTNFWRNEAWHRELSASGQAGPEGSHAASQAAMVAERASCRRLRSPGSKPTKKRLAKERRPGCLPSKTSLPHLSTLSRWPGARLRPLPREEEAFLRSATDDAGRRKAGKPAATMGPSGSTTSPSPSVTRHTGELVYLRSTRSTPTPGVRG